ncbi:MAG TPA: CAP domain-containing protein [Crinalium sp.]|jgi:uncharacterized protein YkwD
MVSDAVGNTIKQAKGLRLGSTVRERIGGGDSSDFYRLNLSNLSNLTISLKSSGGNAHLQLIRDKNQNGKLDSGEAIVTSRARSTSNSIKKSNLATGTYFLRVFPASSTEASYRLTAAAQVVSASPSPSGTPSTSTPSPSPSPAPTSTGSSLIDQVVSLTNQFRQQNGLQPLSANGTLNSVALKHSQNMANQDFFSHTEPDGSQPWDRMTAAGYSWSAAGENIAGGQQTAQEVFNAWVNSSGHRANMLNPNFREIGVGYYELTNDTGNVNYNRYWTQVFGSPL